MFNVQLQVFFGYLENCITYNSFNYLHCDVFQPNKIHHLIQIDNTSDPSVEAVRIAVKL